ncbi:MAG: ArsR/SmtB family transcription factor [Armatimonadota bacterium]|jgi:ArsR family transcriptional regulator
MEELFKALGDPTRLRIIELLARNGETCVCRIVEKIGANQPAVSHHMGRLKQAGLVKARRKGQWIYYSLNLDALQGRALAFLSEIVCLAAASSVRATNASGCSDSRVLGDSPA